MRTGILLILFWLCASPVCLFAQGSGSAGKVSLPVKIVNESKYDADVSVNGFSIGTFKPTEDINLTMLFTELKIVLSDAGKTAFSVKPSDIPEKCSLIVIRDKKVEYCPPDHGK